jgi:ribosomal protein S18 acetylase RimI-like enzyme
LAPCGQERSLNSRGGRALLQHVIDEVTQIGAASMSLQTARGNRQAQRLYEGLGFACDDEFTT